MTRTASQALSKIKHEINATDGGAAVTDQAALYRRLHGCMKMVAGVCDGAAQLDGCGFNRQDTAFGHVLAETDPARWSPKMAGIAHRFAVKYRRQLAGAGIDAEQIPEPSSRANSAKTPGRSVKVRELVPIGFEGKIEGAVLVCQSQGWPGRAAVAAVKAVPGRSFSKTPKPAWRVPLSAARQILELIEAGHIRPAGGVVDTLHARLETMVDAAKLSTATTGEVEITGLGGTLRPFQVAGAEYALKGAADGVIDVRTFIADEMGLGKTVEALAVAKAVHDLTAKCSSFSSSDEGGKQQPSGPIVCIVPKSVKLNWAREAQKWIPGLRRIVVLNGTTVTDLPADADLVILSYGALAPKGWYIDRLKGKPLAKAYATITGREPAGQSDKALHKEIVQCRESQGVQTWVDAIGELNPLTVIVDESHFCKSPKAQRTVAVDHMAHLPSVRCRLLLTGTPVENTPVELMAQLRIIDRLDDLGGWKRFTDRYCIPGKWGGFEQGGQNLDELNAKMRAGGFYVRRMKADVAKELPPKVLTDVPIEIKRGQYDRLLKHHGSRIKAAKLHRIEAREIGREPEGWAVAATMTAITALRQLAAELKIEGAIEWCQDAIEGGQKLIVFAHHRQIVQRLAAELDAPVIMGGTSDEARQAAVDRFQNDPACRVIVLNIVAGGFGITLTASSNVVFVERHLVPAKEDQAIDRAHRIGQEASSVNAWFLTAVDTIDDWVAQVIARKRETVDQVTEGDAETQASVIAELEALIEAAA